MMKSIALSAFLFLFFVSISNATEKPTVKHSKYMEKHIKAETVNYADADVKLKGFVAYNESSKSKRPVVIIVHEWWGLNDYVRNRAKQLADLGYLAIAVDMYGDGKLANNPQEAGGLAKPFYTNPAMAKKRIEAAIVLIKTYAVADTNQIAAIGYCFGGSMVLNLAKLGENLKGVVSFHGGLEGIPVNKSTLKAKILVCHGAADKFVSEAEVDKFKKQLDDAGVPFTFKAYEGATHAFSNPDATEVGKKFNIPIAYNEAADKGSFNEMKLFFGKIFKK